MNFRQIFSFIQTKLKLKNKLHGGIYLNTSIAEPIVYTTLKLADNSIVIGGFFDGYIDSNGINYSSKGILKFMPTGEVDTTFVTNLGSGFSGGISAFTTIYSIITDGVSLYVGGNFTSFKGTANNARCMAKLSTSGIFDTAFSNNLDVVSGTKSSTSGFNQAVYSIATDGTSLYAVGNFNSFKGTAENARYIAKLSTSGIFDTAFSNNLDVVSGTKATTSGFDAMANSIIIDGTNLYIGGNFSTFKGVTYNANRIAKLSTSGVFDTAFSNNLDVVSGTKSSTSGFDSVAHSITNDGTNLYIGGRFTSFKGTANNARKIAKLSISGVFDTTFSNNLDVVSGTKAITSGFDDYNQNAIYSMTADSTSLFLGGTFFSFKNNPAMAFLKISKLGISESYSYANHQFSNNLNTLTIDSQGNRYVGGDANYYNGQYFGRIAKILPNGEIDQTFQTNIGTGFNGTVRGILLDGSSLYVVGDFISFNGLANGARGIAKLSTSGVFDTAFSNNLDVVSGAKATTSGFNQPILSIVKIVNDLYVVGNFTSFKGTANNARYIAKLSITGIFDNTFSNNLDVVSGTKAATSGFDNVAYSIATDGTSLYVGGSFNTFKGLTYNANKLAKFSTSGIFDTAFSDNLDIVAGTKAITSGFNNAIYSVKINSGNIYVGGVISNFKNITNNARGIAKLSTSGIFDTAFSNNLDVVSGTKSSTSGFTSNDVRSIEIYGDSLYAVGLFSSFKSASTNANCVAKLTTSGVFDTAFSNYLDIIPGTKTSASGFNYLVLDVKYDYTYKSLVLCGYFNVFKNEPALRMLTISIST